MIINHKELRKFRKDLARKGKPSYMKNLAIFEALYREAVKLGTLPPKDPLDGIEVDIRIAKVVNSV